ncbi:MAG: hypothetical protein KAH01_03960 [Caldisericia bacterium]|nr:hypothetical protein [Caldisericia bacterium]
MSRVENSFIQDKLGVPRTFDEMEWALAHQYIIPAFRDGNVTVDKLLDHVDLNLLWYIPSIHAIKFMNFMRLVLGEEPENTNPRAHYFLVDCIFQSPNVKAFFDVRNIDFNHLTAETVVLCSREFSKTTIITFLLLFMADEGEIPEFGKLNYGLYVSDSMRNGVKKMMLRLRGIYNESIYLQSKFEEVQITQEEAVFVRHPRSKREVALYHDFVNTQKKDRTQVPGRMKRTFKVDGLGAATSSRGASNVLVRPQFVFIDDVVPNEVDASSDTILESIESTIESDIRGGLSGSGYFIVAIGTPFNKMDPIYRRVEEGLMLPIVFPRARLMPTDNIKETEFESVWADRHTYKNCRREWKNAKKAEDNGNSYKMRKLQQEHYLRIASEEDRLVPDSLIQWIDTSNITTNAHLYNWYGTSDYTTTGTKGSDLSGMILWAVGSGGDFFIIDIVGRKMEIEEQYNETFNMIEPVLNQARWVEHGVELDGGQGGHIYSLKKKMAERNAFFSFAKQKGASAGKQGIVSRLVGGDKHWRFRQMLPLFQNHKIWFSEHLRDAPGMIELLDEIKYTTYATINSKYDDMIDTLSMINAIDVVFPIKDLSHYSQNKKVGMKTSGINAKIWGQKNLENPLKTAYDSYNG